MPDIKLNQPIPFFQTDSKVSVESTTGAAARSQRDAYPVCPWEPSSVLPKRIEMAFFGIAKARNGFRNTNYRLDRTLDTDIDADVGFCNVADVIKYIPRALQVGLLAPFPVALISSKSSYAYGGTFRKIAAVEMIIAYMLFPFAIFFGVVCVRRRALWTLLTFTIGTILMETLAITNLGTLYRHRYGFFMPIISLGVAGLHLMIQRMRSAVPIFGRAHRA